MANFLKSNVTDYALPNLNVPEISGHSLQAVGLLPPCAVCSCGASFDAFDNGALNKFRDHVIQEMTTHG